MGNKSFPGLKSDRLECTEVNIIREGRKTDISCPCTEILTQKLINWVAQAFLPTEDTSTEK